MSAANRLEMMVNCLGESVTACQTCAGLSQILRFVSHLLRRIFENQPLALRMTVKYLSTWMLRILEATPLTFFDVLDGEDEADEDFQ